MPPMSAPLHHLRFYSPNSDHHHFSSGQLFRYLTPLLSFSLIFSNPPFLLLPKRISSPAHPVISLSTSWFHWFICYPFHHLLIKAQHRSMILITLLLPTCRVTFPTMHDPCSGSEVHNFLWKGQACSCFWALLCMWHSFCLECLLQISLQSKFPLIPQGPRTTTTHAVHPSLSPSLVCNVVTVPNDLNNEIVSGL